jgi:hypothetical protein
VVACAGLVSLVGVPICYIAVAEGHESQDHKDDNGNQTKNPCREEEWVKRFFSKKGK